MGFVEETGVAQHFRDARIITIYEGTTGIQANDLRGRKILRENGATLRELIVELARAPRLPAGSPSLATARRAIDALESATGLDPRQRPRPVGEVLAGAVPFLHLLGTACGGWQLGRAALAARARQAAGEGDPVFLGRHRRTPRAYYGMATVGPQAIAHAATVREAGECTDPLLDEAAF